jgi:hypothetical protein
MTEKGVLVEQSQSRPREPGDVTDHGLPHYATRFSPTHECPLPSRDLNSHDGRPDSNAAMKVSHTLRRLQPFPARPATIPARRDDRDTAARRAP